MASEIHGNFKRFFRNFPEPEKERARKALTKHFASITDQLGDKSFLLDNRMTIADPYLFCALRVAPISGIHLPPKLQGYYDRMKQMPSVAQALAERGSTDNRLML